MSSIHDQSKSRPAHDPESERQIEQFLAKRDKPTELQLGKSGFWPFGKSYLTVTIHPNNSSTIKCERVFHNALNIVDILKIAASKLQPGSKAAEGLAEYAQTSAPASSKDAVKKFTLQMAPEASRGQFAGDASAKFAAILTKKLGTKEAPEALLTAFLRKDDSKLTAELKREKESLVREWQMEFARTQDPEIQWTLGFVLSKDEASRFFAVGTHMMSLQSIAEGLPGTEQQVTAELNLLRAKAIAGSEIQLTKTEITTLENLLQKLMQHNPKGDAARDVASFLVYTCPSSFKQHASAELQSVLNRVGALPKDDESVEMLQTLAQLALLEKGPIADTLKLVTIGKVKEAGVHLQSIVLSTPLSAAQIGQLFDLLKLCLETSAARVLVSSITSLIREKSAFIAPHMTLDLRASLPEFKGARGLDDAARNQLADAIDILQATIKLPNDPIEVLGALAEKMTSRTAVYSRVEMQKIISRGIVSTLDAKKAALLLTNALTHALQKEENGESAKLLSQFLLARTSLHEHIPKSTLEALLKLSTGSLWEARMEAERIIKRLVAPIDTIDALRATITPANAAVVSHAIGELIKQAAAGMQLNRKTATVLVQTILTLLKHPGVEPHKTVVTLLECLGAAPALGAHVTQGELRALLDAVPTAAMREHVTNIHLIASVRILADRMNFGQDARVAQEIAHCLQKLQGMTLEKESVEMLLDALDILLENERNHDAASALSAFLLQLPNAKAIISKEALEPLIEATEEHTSIHKNLQALYSKL